MRFTVHYRSKTASGYYEVEATDIDTARRSALNKGLTDFEIHRVYSHNHLEQTRREGRKAMMGHPYLPPCPYQTPDEVDLQTAWYEGAQEYASEHGLNPPIQP